MVECLLAKQNVVGSNPTCCLGSNLCYNRTMPYKDPIKQKQAQRRSYLRNKEKIKDRGKRYKEELRAWLREIKGNGPCMDCGLKWPNYVLHYHHRNPSEKHDGVSKMVVERRSKEEILKEIEKCDLLCANCHAIREYS